MGMTRGPSRILLHVERLVLHGIDPRDRAAIGAAVRRAVKNANAAASNTAAAANAALTCMRLRTGPWITSTGMPTAACQVVPRIGATPKIRRTPA